MAVSPERLVSALNRSAEAVLVAENPASTSSDRLIALSMAGTALCKELKELVRDSSFWTGLEGANPKSPMPTLEQAFKDLSMPSNRTLDDVGSLLKHLGYRPPEEAHEYVRGLCATLHAASLFQRSPSTALTARGLRKRAESAARDFQDSFCEGVKRYAAEEKRNRKLLKIKDSALGEAGKVVLSLVKKGGQVIAIATAAYVLPELGHHLPEPIRAQVCQVTPEVPTSLRPVLLYSFCQQVSGSKPIDRKTSTTVKASEVAVEQFRELEEWQPARRVNKLKTKAEEPPLRLTLGRPSGHD